MKNYIIICDESSKKGANFGYFYGGAIVEEQKYYMLSDILNDYKTKFDLHELKRVKITEKNYKDYIKVMELFFTFVKSGDIKVRIMFSPNCELMTNIPHSQNETFMKFYFTFIVNAFNIFYAKENINLFVLCDDLPETKEQNNKFKECLVSKIKTNKKPNTNKVYITKRQIQEVDSRKHVILQCIDVITGLVDFVLNTPMEEIKKSKRADARFKVWKSIYSIIKDLIPNFEMTKTTIPLYSHKAWNGEYKHFVYHQKIKNRFPNVST